ncbi:MAG TPA: S-layer homology domain-containing protein [Bacillales bacterium]
MVRKTLSTLVIALVALTIWIPQAEASTRNDIVRIAKQYIGVPYQWGGTTPSGFDCSGFVGYVFDKVGVNLPRTSSQMWGRGERVSNLKQGDLVFFNTSGSGISHVGIYIGHGDFISATSDGVEVAPVHGRYYWGSKYVGAKRIIEGQAKSSEQPEQPSLPDYRYYDVDKGDWFYKPVTTMSKNDLLNGYTNQKFKPQDSITRTEAAAVVARVLDLKTSDNHTPFDDVSSDYWGAGAIEAVRKAGIMEGYNGNEFDPKQPITRAEIAALISRSFGLTQSAGTDEFKDVSSDYWAYEAIQKMIAADLTNGYDNGTFRPKTDASRAEFSAFLYRALH